MIFGRKKKNNTLFPLKKSNSAPFKKSSLRHPNFLQTAFFTKDLYIQCPKNLHKNGISKKIQKFETGNNQKKKTGGFFSSTSFTPSWKSGLEKKRVRVKKNTQNTEGSNDVPWDKSPNTVTTRILDIFFGSDPRVKLTHWPLLTTGKGDNPRYTLRIPKPTPFPYDIEFFKEVPIYRTRLFIGSVLGVIPES